MSRCRLNAVCSGASMWALLFATLLFCTPSQAANNTTTTSSTGVRWVSYIEPDGETVYLRDSRKPALYTAAFGDCQGDSLINVTRFDAAYYADNMTVLFHLGGNSALNNESLMMYIGVFAYGESRFDLTFNPCDANINSLCPLNSSVQIEANGIIPVAPSDVAGIPSIALTIPDFEGQAILRIFANSTQSQIACFSAVVTNGNTFSHPAAVGSTLGAFVAIAVISSLAVAMYGQDVPETRKHYAHSLSVFVVFSVLHHIFFTGGLSMNWPSVLVAFWSNYAWSAGMIYSSGMQNSINKFLKGNMGNISMVGSAPSGQDALGLGGGYDISQIYKRNVPAPTATPAALPLQQFQGPGSMLGHRAIEHALAKRDLVNSSTGFSWYGGPVRPGLPLPGNYSGFAGTLAPENIPVSNAFLTGLLWFLILVLLIASSIVLFKFVLEGLVAGRVIRGEKLAFFRRHWLSFTAATVLRMMFIAFFMMMYLTLFQFTFGGATGVIAVAGFVFVFFFIVMMGFAIYAIIYRLRSERFTSEPDRLHVENKRLGFIPWYSVTRESKSRENTEENSVASSLPWWRLHFVDDNPDRLHVHDDERYIIKFGWLTCRFRRSKWWFFSFWLVYELVRACFFGGAAGHALTQVFGILAVEIIAFIAIIIMKPFESNRLNLIMVYLLGFSKVATVALASAFDTRFGLQRILTTAIGIVIIVIQGLLTICLMIAIVLGAISSYMSVMRHREEIKPKSWNKHRERYFKHMDQKATDQPPPPPPPPPPKPEIPPEPYFAVAAVRREPKIEDDDADMEEGDGGITAGRYSLDPEASTPDIQRPVSRSHSVKSRTSASNLPYGARQHRASWSTRDFQDFAAGLDPTQSAMTSRMSVDSIRDTPTRHRAASVRSATATPVARTPSRGENFDMPAERHRKRRSTSNIHRPTVKRNSSIVNEENEI